MANALPISLDQAKRHLRVGDLESDDTLILEDLEMAVSIAETYANRRFFPQTLTDTISPIDGKIYLSDIASVNAVTDSEGNEVAFTASTSALLTTVSVDATLDSVIIEYSVGYTSETLPGAVRAAILLILGTLYDNEADVVVGRSVSQIPMTAKSLLMPYRIVNV